MSILLVYNDGGLLTTIYVKLGVYAVQTPKYFLLLLVFTLLSQTAFAQNSDVTVIWNQDILVVINTSGEDVNVSNLDFVSANGAILASDWVMDTFGDSNLSYSLADLGPGSCLIAYPSDSEEQPALPETVECTITEGVFTLTNFGDIVWDAAQGGFSAQVGGASAADCDITGNSCTVSVATTASNAEDATVVEADESQADILAAWNTDIFVVLNTSEDEVNISSLGFSNAAGSIVPENWVMNPSDDSNVPYALTDVEPGSCLIAYLSTDVQPELPENIICDQTEGLFTMTNINDVVWDASQGGFSATVGGATVSDCNINNTTCTVTVPTTSAESDSSMEMDDMSAGGVRAVWNTDILVIINTGEEAVNLTDLNLSSSAGEILPENWAMNTFGVNNLQYSLEDVAPGSCLISYLSADEQPELPTNITCTRTEGLFTATNINDIVWDVSQGGFSATVAGASTTCDINRTTCDIAVGG